MPFIKWIQSVLYHGFIHPNVFPVLQEVQVGETGSSFVGVAADDTPDADLTAGKKDVFLVDVRDKTFTYVLVSIYVRSFVFLEKGLNMSYF